MAKIGKFTCEVKVAWWLKPYLKTLQFFCIITGFEPNEEKLNNVIQSAITVKPAKWVDNG